MNCKQNLDSFYSNSYFSQNKIPQKTISEYVVETNEISLQTQNKVVVLKNEITNFKNELNANLNSGMEKIKKNFDESNKNSQKMTLEINQKIEIFIESKN